MAFRTTIDRLLVKISRNPGQSQFLRRRFDKLYGIRVGMHTIGAFDRWRLSKGTRFGRYCSIANTARIIDANHPTDSLSTHPVFYLKDWGLVSGDQVHADPTVVEDDVWMGHFSILTPGCKKVGRGAVIGAGAVVMRDVPPYAVMVGSPAQIARFRFSPELIEALEATRWWELDPQELASATKDYPEFLTSPSVEGAQAFLRSLGRPPYQPAECVTAGGSLLFDESTIINIFRREMPQFDADQMNTRFGDLGIDSFGLINVRIALEQAAAQSISDADWSRVSTPGDVLGLRAHAPAQPTPPATANAPAVARIGQTSGDREIRSYSLNMPQMALSGLSEAWLFKEIGDIHWSNLTRGLGTTSARIADDTGSRLYATFTRVLMEGEVPLADFRENDDMSIEMRARRLGGGIFFGDGMVRGPRGAINTSVMTSFSKFGEHGANTSLLKGQPVIPENCPIGQLAEMPPFGLEYKEVRARPLTEPLFATEYSIQAPHDINGVGLLYFAAYPMIAELCTIAYAGNRIATDFSTIKRDIFYFANADVSETLIFKLHDWDENSDGLASEVSLTRKSDNVVMARIKAAKKRIR